MSIKSLFVKRIVKWLVVILLIFFCLSETIFAQSIIYKKDGTQINASKVDILAKTLSYSLLNETDSITHFISKSVIDSIQYENGRIARIFTPIVLPETEEVGQKLKKNFIGVNIWPFFDRGVNGFYERLIYKNKLGFKNQFTYQKYPYSNPGESLFDYSLISGINFYFFHSFLFRFGTGLSFNHEKHDRYDYENMDYESNYYQNYVPKIVTGYNNIVYLNGSFSAIPLEKLYVSLVLDVPLGSIENHQTLFFKTEIAFNF